MSKETKNSIEPKLRFPDFKDLDTWREESLGSICDYWNGASHEGGVTENGDFYLISLNSIDIDGKLKSEMKRLSYTDNSLQKNDLIMVLSDVAHGNFLGLTDIIPSNQFVLNQRMAGLRRKDLTTVNVFFLRTFINYHQKYFKLHGQGSSQLNLSKSSVTEFPVLLPHPKEQQKIADCLSSLDELIFAENQILDALKVHKKGLMQQLFPSDGETVPKLRFEEFKDSGEWEYSKIEDYIDLLSGIPLKSEELIDDASGIPILRGINITEGYIRHSKDIDKYFLGDIEGIKKYIIKKNDLVIAMDGSKVGKNVALINKKDENSILIQRVARIRANKKSDIRYIYQHIFSEKFQNYVDKVNTSSGIPHISSQQIKDFKIGFPSLKEQQKVADCLSSLDEFITGQAEKIEQLKEHKKGLMQGLFPYLN
ncbi:MAG: restriction endonuclease subunit S [Saprospiraceae bacterium]